jgi:hypothetical protein
MGFVLKKNTEEFQVVDGPLAGRKFKRGKVYGEIPEGEAHRFEKLEDVSRREAETQRGKKK